MDREQNNPMSFVEQQMIRIYKYDRLDKIIVVPYAFLKPLSYEGIFSFYNVLYKWGLVQKKELFKAEIREKRDKASRYLEKYLYSLEIYVSSLILGNRFLSNHGMKDISWNKKIEEYNLGYCFNIRNEISDDLAAGIADEVKGRFCDYADDTAVQLYREPEIESLIEKIKEIDTISPSVSRFIESYMKLSGGLDEKLAEDNKSRMPGIEYLRLLQYFSRNKLKDVWKTIIQVIDSGKGTLSAAYNTINQSEFMDCRLYPGEQNFAGNETNLIYFIYPLLEYECRMQNDSLSEPGEQVIEEGKGGLIRLILEWMPELQNKVDADELKMLIRKSIRKSGIDYYMARYPVYMDDSKLKMLLERAKSYGRG